VNKIQILLNKLEIIVQDILEKKDTKQITFVVANLINFGFGSIFWIIATHIYSVEDIGYASNAIVATSFLGSLSLFGLNLSIMKKYANDFHMIQKTLFFLGICVSTLSLVFICIYILFLRLVNIILFHYLISNIFIFLSFVIIIIVWGWMYLQESVLIITKKPIVLFIRNFLFGSLRVILLVSFSFIFKSDFNILISWALSAIISFILSVIPYIRKIKINFISITTFTNLYKLSFKYFIIYQLLGSSAFILSTFVISKYGAESNGIFYISWMIASFLYTIPRSISLYTMPEFVQSSNQTLTFIRTVKLGIILSSIGFGIFATLGKFIFSIFGKEFITGSYSHFLILSFAVFPMTLFRTYFELIRANDNLRMMFFFSLFQPIMLSLILLTDFFFHSLFVVSLSWTLTQFTIAIIVLFKYVKHKF